MTWKIVCAIKTNEKIKLKNSIVKNRKNRSVRVKIFFTSILNFFLYFSHLKLSEQQQKKFRKE